MVNISIQRITGDTGGQGGATGGRDAVRGHVHRPSEGNSSILGVPMISTVGLCAVNLL